jgi:hypothetical protein
MGVPAWAQKSVVEHQGDDALPQKWANDVPNSEMGYAEAMKDSLFSRVGRINTRHGYR